MRKRKLQSGQTLVLLSIGLVGLIGFAALAIDGGLIYAERRRAQNAADTGALAAALELARNGFGFLVDGGRNRIDSNGYDGVTWGNCIPVALGSTFCREGTAENWTVKVENPPRGGDFQDKDEYIRIIINTEVNTAFAHLVFDGPLETTVEAVARAYPERSITMGNAMYAAGDEDGCGLSYVGNGNTLIDGGDIFSNSDGTGSPCWAGDAVGNGDVTVTNGGIKVVGDFNDVGAGTVSPAPETSQETQDLRPVPTPDCSGLPNWGGYQLVGGGTDTIEPGIYEDIVVVAGGNLTLNSGLYCILGDVPGDQGFKSTGGTITGTDVMIYLGPLAEGIDLGGNTVVALAAANADGEIVDASGNDWKGMLIYAHPDNTSNVIITGDTDTTYTGTVYAPSSECTITGNGDNINLLSSQVMCETVKIAGDALVDIHYAESEVFHLPPAIELAQ